MDPPLDPPAPASSAPREKRPHTILGRLAKAVREQNWFAVVLEVLIVIVGVVIGFQVTSWGQDRADRAREQTYLRQLVEDLKQTEANMDRFDGWNQRLDVSAAMLVRSFRSGSTPSADSVLRWASESSIIGRPIFVTGTVDALVETGDLNLIQDDSLRSGITDYIDRIEQIRSHLAHNDEDSRPYIATLSERVDFGAAEIARRSPAELDSLARADPSYPIPEAPQRAFEPVDVEALMRDREAYTAIWNVSRIRRLMAGNRRHGLEATVALREQIEAALDR
jgi:hypothetical protein